MSLNKHGKIFVYIGSYTRDTETGINLYSYDPAVGSLIHLEGYSELEHPSFLAIDHKNLKLYAVSETMEYTGISGGSVASYDIDAATGRLTYLNRQPTYGGAPCHLSVDQSGKCLFVSNYMGGSVGLFPLETDGSIGEQTDLIEHHGSGMHPQRQSSAHAHSILPDPLNKYAIVADLGIDKLMTYEIDFTSFKLYIKNETFLTPGSGPRHFVFHPLQNFLYLCNELDSTITAFTYDPENGTLLSFQKATTLPSDFKSNNTCADIHLSQDGRFLYASNRGLNTIVVFAVNESDGSLLFIEQVPTGGCTPRNFAISPDGAYLLVANQDSDDVFLFKRDHVSGCLQTMGRVIEVSKPVCIQFLSLD